jgi:hypothetical protein
MALLWLNEIAFNAQLVRIPQALHSRFCDSFDELATNLGIQAVDGGNGVMEVDIRGASAPNFFKFCEDASVCAVSIGPQDVVPLMGRNLDSLLLKRAIEQGSVRLEKIPPDELMSSMREAAWELQQTPEEGAPETQGAYREAAVFELQHAGLLTPQEAARDARDWDEGLSERASGKHDGGGNHGELPLELTETAPDKYDPFL